MRVEVDADQADEVARQALPRVVERAASAVVDVGSEALGAAFQRFLAELGDVFSAAPDRVGPFAIEEVELSLSIGASGDFRIAKSTAEAALKVTLRRPVK